MSRNHEAGERRDPSMPSGWSCGPQRPIAARENLLPSSCRRDAVGVIDNVATVLLFSNMKAELPIDERHVLDPRTFVEIVVWRLPRPAWIDTPIQVSTGTRGRSSLRVAIRQRGRQGRSSARAKCREPYRFTNPDALLADFWRTSKDGGNEMKTVTSSGKA